MGGYRTKNKDLWLLCNIIAGERFK